MKTTRSNRPTGAPAYYLGRSAETWQAVLREPVRLRRTVSAGAHDGASIRDTALRFYVTSGSRWN
jgi:hypothetical protein